MVRLQFDAGYELYNNLPKGLNANLVNNVTKNHLLALPVH